MKARNLIPGWPKGGSTSTARLYANNSSFLRWMLRGNRWDQPERLEEFNATVAYHEAQQRMNDRFFEKWRSPIRISDAEKEPCLTDPPLADSQPPTQKDVT